MDGQQTLDQLRDEMAFSLRTAEKITESADEILTDAQIEEVRSLQEQAEVCKKKIEQIEYSNEIRGQVKQSADAARQPLARAVPQSQPGGDPHSMDFKVDARVIHAHPRKWKAFESAEAAHRAGQWFLSEVVGTMNGYHAKAKVQEAKRWVRDYAPEMRALSTTVSTSGGVLVPEEMANAIIERREQFGVFENFANTVPINPGGTTRWPRCTSDQMATFGAEASDPGETDPAFSDISMNAKELKTLTKVSNALFRGSPIDIAFFMAREFGRRFAKRIDTAGFIGDASEDNGGILGITKKVVSSKKGGYRPPACDNFADITTNIMHTFAGLLPEYAAAGTPAYFVNRMGKELALGRLQTAGGGNTKMDLAQGTFDSYNGIPIVTTQVMAGTESDFADEDPMMILGDLEQSTFFGDAGGMEIMTSEHRYFENNQVGIRAVQYCDINVYDVGDTTTAGSVCVLISD